MSLLSSSTQKECIQKLTCQVSNNYYRVWVFFCQYYLNKVAEHIVSEGAVFQGVSTVRLNKKQILTLCAEMTWHKKEITYRFSM